MPSRFIRTRSLFLFNLLYKDTQKNTVLTEACLLSRELRYLHLKVKGSMVKYWVIGPFEKCWEIGDREKGVESDPLH